MTMTISLKKQQTTLQQIQLLHTHKKKKAKVSKFH